MCPDPFRHLELPKIYPYSVFFDIYFLRAKKEKGKRRNSLVFRYALRDSSIARLHWTKVHLLMSPCACDPASGYVSFSRLRLSRLPRLVFVEKACVLVTFLPHSTSVFSQLILNALRISSYCLEVPHLLIWWHPGGCLATKQIHSWVPKEEAEQKGGWCMLRTQNSGSAFTQLFCESKGKEGLWEGGGTWKG